MSSSILLEIVVSLFEYAGILLIMTPDPNRPCQSVKVYFFQSSPRDRRKACKRIQKSWFEGRGLRSCQLRKRRR